MKYYLHKNNKVAITLLMAALIALSPFAIDSFLSAMPDMAVFFGVEFNVIELIITMYFLGFSLGNFLGGPLSDAFGRKKIALIGVVLYGVSALIIPQCTAIEYVLLLRVFQAFGGGFATVTSNLFIRDWYKGKEVAKLITITTMIMMLAPLFAPIIGAYIAEHVQWQGVFYFLTICALLLFVVFSVFVPESRSKELLTHQLTIKQLVGKYKLFLSDKKSVIFMLAISFPASGLYAFITTSSFIYLDYFNVDPAVFPLIFGANIALNITLSMLNTFLLKQFTPKTIMQFGLWLQLTAGLLLGIEVLFLGAAFWHVFVLMVLFIGSLGLIFGNGIAIILGINPEVSATANGALGIFRFLLGFLIGTLIAVFHTENLIPIAVGMFICSLVGNLFFLKFKSLDKNSQ
ncbi:multidrug effflux MFS transporter [Ochrovirga pacifica]|uniref:multidrug effflux MFS transporter n=1 Tax=Ochrovirga pacifica TaxID=1042376 RepID=UPI0002557B4A|nr:multidrug effflux MFS transporter [Ochrovirga pacifica]